MTHFPSTPTPPPITKSYCTYSLSIGCTPSFHLCCLTSSYSPSPLKDSLLLDLPKSTPAINHSAAGDFFEGALITSPHSLKLLSGSIPNPLPRSVWSCKTWSFLPSNLSLSLSFAHSLWTPFRYQSLVTSGPLYMLYLLSIHCFLPLLPQLFSFSDIFHVLA